MAINLACMLFLIYNIYAYSLLTLPVLQVVCHFVYMSIMALTAFCSSQGCMYYSVDHMWPLLMVYN